MKKLIFSALMLVAACNSSNHAKKSDVVMIAWNEDTVVNYRIAFIKDHSFLYTTEDTIHQQKIVTGYSGHYRRSKDTVYLSFKGKKQPPMRNFLIIASGGYLSQQFRDHRTIMYLRYRFGPAGRHAINFFF